MDLLKVNKIIRKSLILSFVFLNFFFLNACQTTPTPESALSKIAAEDEIINKQTSLAMGQRSFDTKKLNLIKAIITAFADNSLTVKNLDKEVGFISAEGTEFLDPKKAEEMGKKHLARLNKAFSPGKFNYTPGNYILNVSVNLFEKGENRTLAKMGFNIIVTGNYSTKSHTVPSGILPEYYNKMWENIDKALFIQREAIKP
jgi:hypothetical protein